MPNKPLLSIVISTKNRYNYLKILVLRLLQFKRSDFEIIIQDNSNNNKEISTFLNLTGDDRIKYFYHPEKLDVCANSDLAVGHSQGEYVCFVGDDDGITEESINICYFLKKHDIDSANCNIAIYDWPDLFKKYYGYATSGEVRFQRFTGKITEIDHDKELIKILRFGAQVVRRGVRLYQGIIRKECLDRLKAHTGTYFPGPVPDMSSAIGVIPFIDKHVFVDYPLIIAGSSGKSTAGMGAKKKHQGEIREISHLPLNTADNWSKEIPFYWSGPTIWAEGALQALKNTGQSDLIRYFNFNNVLALCLVYDNDFRMRTIKHIFKNIGTKDVSLLKISYYVVRIWLRRVQSIFLVLASKISYQSKKSDATTVKADSISQVIDYFSKSSIIIDFKEAILLDDNNKVI